MEKKQIKGRHFKETFEDAQWRKAKQMQPVLPCIRSGIFGNTVVQKLVTHMESVKTFEYSMRQIIFTGWNVNSEFPSL